VVNPNDAVYGASDFAFSAAGGFEFFGMLRM
jgi:hypothetical protein